MYHFSVSPDGPVGGRSARDRSKVLAASCQPGPSTEASASFDSRRFLFVERPGALRTPLSRGTASH
eukprot:1330527-Alexandrium_andersonii.AAC.1